MGNAVKSDCCVCGSYAKNCIIPHLCLNRKHWPVPLGSQRLCIWNPVFRDTLLETSIGKGLGVIKGLKPVPRCMYMTHNTGAIGSLPDMLVLFTN